MSARGGLCFLMLLLFVFQTEASDSVQLYLGVNFFSYDLKSDQFSAQQPTKSGNSVSLVYENYNIAFLSKIRASLNQSTNSLTTDAALSPRSVDTVFTNFQILYLKDVILFNDLDYLRIGLGYSFYNSKTSRTDPNVLMVDSDMHAIDLLSEYDLFSKNDFTISALFDLGLPFIRKEYGVSTGFDGFYYYLSAGYSVRKLVDEKWSVVHKAEYFWEQNKFSGTGDRGTTNAQEKFQYFKFLVGAGYDF